MHAIVLGSAAGGGVPQWNCRCPVCALAWTNDPRVSPRTQSSIAVSLDGERWLLVNASPDLRQQITATPALHPRGGSRHSPIAAVLLTNGDVDHVAGLLTLREGQGFVLYGTPGLLACLVDNPVFEVLAADRVVRREIALGMTFQPLPGLAATLFAVPGKAPLWLEDDAPVIGAETEATVGALFDAAGRRLAYVPGCAEVTQGVRARLDGVDILLFDGTVHHDDDLARAGVGTKTGRRMGHVPMRGAGGSIAALAGIAVGRRIFVHLNNTNPVLVEGSPERVAVEVDGWAVARDGDRFEL